MISEKILEEYKSNYRILYPSPSEGNPITVSDVITELLASRQSIEELEDKLVNVTERLRAREDPFNHNLSDMSCAFIEYNAKMQDETIRELQIPKDILGLIIKACSMAVDSAISMHMEHSDQWTKENMAKAKNALSWITEYEKRHPR